MNQKKNEMEITTQSISSRSANDIYFKIVF